MGPVERLQAAIDKLEKLKAESASDLVWSSTGGLVEAWDEKKSSGVVIFKPTVRWETRVAANNALLVATLHRTIEAQLAILRDEYQMCSVPFAGMYKLVNELPLALADAIINQGDADAPTG
jgi:hypothetical protein